jgi:hypothetical protein
LAFEFLKMQAVCFSPAEVRRVCPLTICGIAPPFVRPIGTPMVPPAGTTSCAPEQRLKTLIPGVFQACRSLELSADVVTYESAIKLWTD